MGKGPSQSRRIVTRLLVFLLLFLTGGAIVNVAVAWGCAIALAEKSTFDMRISAAILPNGNLWSARRLDRSGYFRIESHVSAPIERWSDQWEHPQSIIETWSRIPHPNEEFSEWEESASGWPCAAAWSRLTILDPLHDVDWRPNVPRILPRDRLEGGLVVDWSYFASPYILPIALIWPGFAINTIFYAAILWVMFLVPGVLSRKRRSRRGLCIHCGYDLRGAAPGSANCPECGKPRARLENWAGE